MIPSPSSVSGGRTIGKIAAHSPASDLDRRADPLSAKAAMSTACGCNTLGQGATDPTVLARHDMEPRALQHAEGGYCADLAQSLRWTHRQVHPGRTRAVHHVDVVVARQRDHKFGQSRVCGQCGEKLGPLGGAPGVGQVSRYQDHVQRLRCMDLIQPRQRLPQPLVAARTGPPALDAKPVALADRVDVRQMRNAPLPIAG